MSKQMTNAELLVNAEVGIDPCHSRGKVCRGAYIVADEVMYLTRNGEWTHGIAGYANWWDTEYDAEIALKVFKINSNSNG